MLLRHVRRFWKAATTQKRNKSSARDYCRSVHSSALADEQALSTTNEQESQLVVSHLLALPHLADTTTSTTPLLHYLCSLPAPSPPQIDSFAKLTINKPCDPRYPLLFLAKHGSAVCMLGDRCIGLWKGVRVWQEKALETWQNTTGDVSMDGDLQQVDEVSRETLVPLLIASFASIASVSHPFASI